MSKYNHFAKDLDAAFKTSRNAYAKVYFQYAQAERAAKDAQRRALDDTDYSYALRKAETEVVRVEWPMHLQTTSPTSSKYKRAEKRLYTGKINLQHFYSARVVSLN